MKMKYIVVADDAGREIPIIFGEALAHKGVFDGLRIGQRSYSRRYETYDIVSAGFVEGIGTDKVRCFGESESLGGVKSRGEIDAVVLCGGKSKETITAEQNEDKRTQLLRILNKQDPKTRHLSSSARQRAAIEFATANFPEETETLGVEGFINILNSDTQ